MKTIRAQIGLERRAWPAVATFTPFERIALSLASVVVAVLIAALVYPLLPPGRGSTIPLIGAIAFSAYVGGAWGATLSAFVGYVAVEYFFVLPVGGAPTPIGIEITPDTIYRVGLTIIVAYFMGWLQDRWRRAWLEQRRLSGELESILAAADDGIVLLDENLQVLYANARAARQLGSELPLEAGKLLREQLGAEIDWYDEQDLVLKLDDLPFGVGAGYRTRSVLLGCGERGKDIERWVTVKTGPIYAPDGSVQSTVVILTDATAQQRALRRSEQERQRLNAIFSVLSDAVIVTDASGVITRMNPAAGQLIGTTDEVIGCALNDVIDLASELTVGGLLDSLRVSPNGPVSLPNNASVCTTQDESIPVAGSIALLPDQSGAVMVLRDLREELDAERARLEGERRLRDMIDHLVCQIALLDLDGHILEHNGRTSDGAYSPEPIGAVRAAFAAASANGRDSSARTPAIAGAFERALVGDTVRMDFVLSPDNADSEAYDVQLAPLYDADGKVTNLVFSAVDITERRKAQHAGAILAAMVNAERKRLEDIIEAIPALVWEADGRPGVNQHVTMVNSYTERLLGYTQTDWLARKHPWASIMHPDDVRETIRLLQMRYDGESDDPAAPIQFRVRARNGAILMLEMRVTMTWDDHRQPIGMRGIALDITAQKEAERQIARLATLVEISRQRLQDMVDAVQAMVWEAVGPPEDQQYVFVNNYVEQLTGYTAQEWIDHPQLPVSIIVPEDLAEVAESIRQNYYEDARIPIQYRLRTRDGKVRWVESRASTVRSESGEAIGVRGVTTDITDLRQTEIELRRSNEDLQQFAYIASHDLQEPLRMVISYLQLIEQRYVTQLDEPAHEFIHFAVDGAMRMKQMITDLLAYSRVQTRPEDFAPVDLNQVVAEVLLNLESMIRDVSGTVIVDELPTIMGNQTLLTQLFQNLLNNALKFRSQRPAEIRIAVERQGLVWRFSVQDNGIGFDARFRDRIFTLFQRLHSHANYDGTGIGLAVCKKVVETHGGEIWAESEPGGGATFCFTLPVLAIEETHHA